MDYNAEVEKIIILQLSSLGLDIKGFPDLVNKEMFYASTVFLVKTILPPEYTENVPEELAKGFGAWTRQMKQAKEIAKLVKETLKYDGELTFDNVLYPNELHVRGVLSYLIQLVQRKKQREETLKADPGSKRVGMGEKVLKYLDSISHRSYTLSFSRKVKPHIRPIQTNSFFFPSRMAHPGFNPSVISQNKKKDQLSISVFEDNLKSLTKRWALEKEWQARGSRSGMDRRQYFQVKKKKVRGLIGAILRRQGGGYSLEDPFLRNSRRHGQKDENGMSVEIREAFSRRVNFESIEMDKLGESQRPKEEEEAEAQVRRENEIEQLNTLIEKQREGMGKLKDKMQSLKVLVAPLSRNEEKEKKIQVGLMEEFNVLKTTCQLYENKEENLRKLKKISSQSAQDLMKMNTEWEKQYRLTKVGEIRSLKHQILHYKEQYKEETERIHQLKQKMSDMIQEIKQKQTMSRSLAQYYNSLPKDKDRNFYVEKILNIVRNINNQNQQIQKILIENKEIKGNISTTTEKALTIFKQLEDLVFEKAKEDGEKNPKLKGSGFNSELYLSIMNMHKEFEKMIRSVNEEGEFLCEIRDLDSEIEKIQQRKDEENLRRVQKDLMAIKKENVEFVERVKKVTEKVKKFELESSLLKGTPFSDDFSDGKKVPSLLEGII